MGAPREDKTLSRPTRLAWWVLGLAVLSGIVYLMGTASTGPVDVTEIGGRQSHGTVVFNSGMIVFREGLEAVLIFAAVIGSFVGANRARRRPVVMGAVVSLAAVVVTWFVVDAVLAVASPLGPRLEAITGFIAVVVLLVVLNWFVHTVYWTGWIRSHHRRRREILGKTGLAATIGLVALGFTSVYREGFEVVLFLQNLKLEASTAWVLEGVALGLAGTAAVGAVTFFAQRKLPYRRMLEATGVLIAIVLVVMIGGTALTFQDLGWLPQHALPFGMPKWLGSWFEIYPYWETVGAQVFAAVAVVGSYFAAQRLVKRRARKLGQPDPRPAEREPVLAS